MLAERIEQAAAFCEPPGAGVTPQVSGKLAQVRDALAAIARSLAAHLPSRQVPSAPPAEELPALLDRALSLFRTSGGDSSEGHRLRGVVHRGAGGLPGGGTRLPFGIIESGSRGGGSDYGQRAAAARRSFRRHFAGPRAARADLPVPEPRVSDGSVAELVQRAATDATRLRAQLADAAPPQLLEAVAALQRVAMDLGASGTEFAALQRGLRPRIVVADSGPYLVTNAAAVRSYLGEPLPVPPQVALCRCGQSGDKPFCDGSHARAGFSGAKDPKRVQDRRDTYPGVDVTVFDNRGICQHSGFCTDRLPTVFRTDAEPFVAPSGGRMDEIVRAVRDCPSGALSMAVDGTEARDLAEWHNVRQPAIEVSLDGPYRVTGGIPLADSAGAEVPRAAGSSREHYALCRCGHSQNKPFCSGMHWYIRFRDPGRPADPTLFEWAGGLPALTRMTRLLYEKLIPADDLLAPAFADLAPGAPEREAAWLAAAFGGFSRDGAAALAGRDLGAAQRARWATLAVQAAQEARLPDEPSFRAALTGFFEWASRSPAGSVADPPRWDWGPGGPPDTGSEPASEGEPGVTLPGPEETVGFEAHIRPLFREKDRTSMRFAFDLWSRDDVRRGAPDILQRLRDGTMPCDGAWPRSWTDVFARWTEFGFQP